MKLRDLLAGVPLVGEHPDLNMEISSISYDTRTLEPGALFVAVAGDKTDGHRYIPQALDRGAAAVLCQTPPEGPGPWVVVVLPLVPVTAMRVIPSPGRPNQLAETRASASRLSSVTSQGPGPSGGVWHRTAAAPRSKAAWI